MASKLVSVLLAIAVVALFSAWRMQTSAGDALAAARSLQEAEMPGSGAEPGSVEDYRTIVETLDDSIAIRARIDGLLGEVESIMRRVNVTQEGAIATAEVTRRDISLIGTTLGGSIDASRDARSGLAELRRKLARSAALGRKIADELEELDENLGPRGVLP